MNGLVRINRSRAQPVAVLTLIVGTSIVLTPLLLLLAQPSYAAQTSSNSLGQASNSESTSSSQPLWSYQIKPANYVSTQLGGGQTGNSHYTGGASAGFPSLFDAFSGLSQRQGALTSSPFMSILPIILIAAGGMLLLLPLFTMMVASPFGGAGAFGGNYQNPFGYPQSLSKRRSLADNQLQQRGIVELIEHFSSTIEDLSRKYSNGPMQSAASSQQQPLKRTAKSLEEPAAAAAPANHKPSNGGDESNYVGTNNNNLFGATGSLPAVANL